MKEKIMKLIEVKSIVTILMTISMVLLLTGVFKPTDDIFALYSMSYGSVITYFFTRKSKESE
jgi:hypothetical protein